MPASSNWREWYHFRHAQACHASGLEFEGYATRVLMEHHDDFLNPSPAGTLGDGGCDGLAENGSTLYACYGQRPGRRAAERELADKIESDFARALATWDTFTSWVFVTNAPVGPIALATFTKLANEHLADAPRPLKMRIWTVEKLWNEVLSELDENALDRLFPGVPGAANLELSDLVPLLDAIGGDIVAPADTAQISPVSAAKMDFNGLPPATRLEFNEGRLFAPRIDQWYSDAAEADLLEQHGMAFRSIYSTARDVVSEPAEILERIYIALAGSDFRQDRKRANAAYAVASYFFDTCHIFEAPPHAPGGADATTQ